MTGKSLLLGIAGAALVMLAAVLLYPPAEFWRRRSDPAVVEQARAEAPPVILRGRIIQIESQGDRYAFWALTDSGRVYWYGYKRWGEISLPPERRP